MAQTVDFAFVGDTDDERLIAPFVIEDIFKEHYVGVMCHTHPLAEMARKNELSFDDWLRFPHVRFGNATPGISSID